MTQSKLILKRLATFGFLIIFGASLIFSPYFSLKAAFAATNYYVATYGLDTNYGTIAAPFRTIQKCADIAVAGDTCNVRGGTYRETVTPSTSGSSSAGILFQPYNNEAVTIDGSELVTGWSLYTGNIYRTSLAPNSSLFDNQIFVDNRMMNLARWPNIGQEPLDGNWGRAQSNTTTSTIYDSSLPNINWNGATVHIWAGDDPFVHQTGIVTASVAGQVSFSGANKGCPYLCMKSDGKYYLTGVLAALDAPGEWFYDSSSQYLYLWTVNGDNPANRTVKAKKRNYAFDLSNRAYIQVKGFNVFAATILTNGNSNHNIIDGINAQYLSHYTTLPTPPSSELAYSDGEFNVIAAHEWDSGIIITGTNNILRNSTLAYSAGNGVRLGGSSNTVTNTLIHDVNYMGSYAAGISASGNNQTISRNTIYRTGRDGILVDWHVAGKFFLNNKISYNNIFQALVYSVDGGGIYVCCADGTGTSMEYNWLHDSAADQDYFATSGSGLYIDSIDNTSNNYLIHHNVTWNNGTKGNGMSIRGPVTQNDLVYNNTFGLNQGKGLDYPGGSTTGVRVVNNIYSQSSDTPSGGAYVANNSPSTVNPLFVNTTTGDYRLQNSSPAKDGGQVIAGITDGYSGTAPDQGAYEIGGTNWVPGCNLYGCTFPLKTVIDDRVVGSGQNQFNYSGSGWQNCTGYCGGTAYFNSTVSYSNVTNDQFTFAFSGVGVQLYVAKWEIAGFAGVSIDGGPETAVDLYTTGSSVGDQLAWSSPVLSLGNHTLKVRITGTKNPGSGGTYIPIDRVNVIQGSLSTTVDDLVQGSNPNQYNFVGGSWQHCYGSCTLPPYYNGSVSYNNVTNEQLIFDFSGIGIQFYAAKWSVAGIAGISIDGGPETAVDLYTASASQADQLAWSSPLLTPGNHTLRVRVTGTKNASSGGTYIPIDRINILQ